MAYTGVDLYNSILFRTYQGKAGAYLNIDRANEIIRSGRVKLLDDDWKNIVTQQAKDEISPLIKTGKTYTPNNNKVLLKPLIISSVSIGANAVITFNRPHNLAANTPIVVSGVQGTIASTINISINTYTILNSYSITTTINTNGLVYTSGTGKAISDGYLIDDYYHLLAIQLYCKQKVSSILSRTFDNTKFVLTAPSLNNIRTGEYLCFAANPSDEGSCAYVKKIAYNKIQLFADASLNIPITNTDSDFYLVGWSISRYLSRYADPLNSDQKIDTYKSTAYFPLSEVTENQLGIELYKPYQNQLDTSITQLNYIVDYVTTLPDIDLENDVYDIYQIHNANFYDRLIEYAALKFQAVTSSGEDVQITEVIGGFKE
jgi:hypothetical protein